MKNVTILGSTGSIGTQALEIIRDSSHKFNVAGLTCGKNIKLLSEQILEFRPRFVCVDQKEDIESLRKVVDCRGIEVLYGEEGLIKAAQMDTDIILNSLMGMRGMLPTIKGIEAGHDIALANKETLVAGGEIVMEEGKKRDVKILPVDSEHSAIFQCLEGNKGEEIKRILLTASGGPFRGWSEKELENVTPEKALKHPNWSMGRKITIDSATMMNKGLEIIEAMHLFDVPVDRIEVLVHPQSIIHSGVEFKDRAILAQLGTPDMKVPISVALNYPERMELSTESVDFFGKGANLTFEKPDLETFKCLGLAIKAAKEGGTLPAVMNAANEVLVELFLNNEIGFIDIGRIIEMVMNEHIDRLLLKEAEGKDNKKLMVEEILKADRWARDYAGILAKECKVRKGEQS